MLFAIINYFFQSHKPGQETTAKLLKSQLVAIFGSPNTHSVISFSIPEHSNVVSSTGPSSKSLEKKELEVAVKRDEDYGYT